MVINNNQFRLSFYNIYTFISFENIIFNFSISNLIFDDDEPIFNNLYKKVSLHPRVPTIATGTIFIYKISVVR